MRRTVLAFAAATLIINSAPAATIYPIDRATMLVNSPFDFKVEFSKVVQPAEIKVLVNGQPYEAVFGKKAVFVPEEKDKDGAVLGSALILRDLTIAATGAYTVEVRAGDETRTVSWDVYGTATKPKTKNIIFLIGDGLSVGHRTAARIMSKGMTEGKANGLLAMDSVPPVAFIGTSSTHSIATDSANTMSAYMTGHKSRVNALGVYADRTPDTMDDPKVETIAERCDAPAARLSASSRTPKSKMRPRLRSWRIRGGATTRPRSSACSTM